MYKLIVIATCLFALLSCGTTVKEVEFLAIDLTQSKDLLELFAPEIISTHLNERDLAIAPNGDEIVYTLSNYDNTIRALVTVVQIEGEWRHPEIISFSGINNDIEPFFSPDGSRLFFASDRPLSPGSERKDYNIWYAERSDKGWDPPQAVMGPINTEKDEFYPSVSQSGNLYFTASYDNAVGQEDIYMSEYHQGNYTAPVPLDTTVNSSTYEFNAYVSPDEQLIVFSSFGRADGLGGGDLYMSKKDTLGHWQKAVNLGPEINSDRLDYCPFIDFDRGNFYFTSNRRSERRANYQDIEALKNVYTEILNGMGNIYRTGLTNIGINSSR